MQPLSLLGNTDFSTSTSLSHKGVSWKEISIQLLRDALSIGIYAGQFSLSQLEKSVTSKRPIIFSQEHIISLENQLVNAGIKGL